MTVLMPKKPSDAKIQSYINQGLSKESRSLEVIANLANKELQAKPSLHNSLLKDLIDKPLLQRQEEIDRIRDWIADDYLALGSSDLVVLAAQLKTPNPSSLSSFVALLEPMLESNDTSNRAAAASMIVELLKDPRASARYAALEVISSQLDNINIARKLLEQAEQIMANEEVGYITEYLQCLAR
jgi:hypothetical protein